MRPDRVAALDAQVRVLGPAEADDLGVEREADAVEHLEAEVLGALLDAVHGALARAEPLGELGLREAPVLAGAADERADLREGASSIAVMRATITHG